MPNHSGAGIPVTGVSIDELLEAFGFPRLRTRTELRGVIFTIWPILNCMHPA